MAEIVFDGHILGNLSNKELRTVRRSMAMIFQSFNLLMQKNVLSNVMLPMKIAHMSHRVQRERALQMLKVVGLEGKANAWPAQLSGGQRQRVAIARALAMNQKFFCVMKQPVLLSKNNRGNSCLLKGINRKLNLTIVIITHEMSVVRKNLR